MIRAFALVLCLVAASYASEYTTFIGDSVPYQVSGIATDSSGNTYLAGTRTLDQNSEAFVMKLDPAGATVFFRVISGTGSNSVAGIALDAAGDIYLGGSTSSSDFPLYNALLSTPGKGFLVKLDPGANQTIWSTYFREAITALAVDPAGNIYVTGSTNDSQFPVTAGLPNGPVSNPGLSPVSGAFITKISATGDRILYSGIISGNDKPCGCCSSCFVSARNVSGASLAVDSAGNAYLAGNTDTSNIPTTSGAFLASGTGAFIAKVKSDGSGLGYLTYIGATNYPISPFTNPANTATAIACDANGNAYLTGSTSDPKFPATSGALQTTFGGSLNPNSFQAPPTDAFALELNSSGAALVWATFLGGTGVDAGRSIALDSSGQAWIVGTTASQTFPNTNGWSQGSDFVTGFDTTGSKLVYSARYPNGPASQALAVDSAGTLHIAGPAGSVSTVAPGMTPVPRIFGVTNAAWGPLDARVVGGEVISIYGPHIGPSSPVIAMPDASGNLPTSVAGYQVIAKNVAQLPLLYLSDSQINAVVPFLDQSTTLSVSTTSGNTPPFFITFLPAIPEIFRNPDGTAVAVNQDGTLNSSSNPAPYGSYVSIWATGTKPAGAAPGYAGQIATAANNYSCCAIAINGLMPPVTYAGAAPGVALGVVQMNFQVVTGPLYGSSPHLVDVTVIANDGTKSHPAGIYVH